MKLEVLFVGSSIDSETYEGPYATWVFKKDQLVILMGASKKKVVQVASYPGGRVVRVRVI